MAKDDTTIAGQMLGPGASDPRAPVATRDSVGAVDAFLKATNAVAKSAGSRARLAFALDATMSRQPTWDVACTLQAGMFAEASALGGLDVQLVYFRGFAECRASKWVGDAQALTGLMTRISCAGGHTQIGRVLAHVRAEAGRVPVAALVYVGDAMEERLDDLCRTAGELGLLGVKAFMFQEGSDRAASTAFAEIARLTGGAHAPFDVSSAARLGALLRAAAAYAAGGRAALERLALGDGEARLLLRQMR